jgi:aryl-alcohol dehydrogenase-like predicted oxidoreductase
VNPKEQVRLGSTGVVVTRLGLGAGPLGGMFAPVDAEDAAATVDAAWNAGLRLFDTAPLYGYGRSEQLLGRALADRDRTEYALSTKVGRLLRSGGPGDPRQRDIWKDAPPLDPIFDFTREGVLRSLDESLARLGLERVDIVHIHDPDDHYDEAIRGAYEALNELRQERRIGALGVGMNQAEALSRFARDAHFDCFLLAGRYTLLDQSALRELLPLCEERGIAIIAGGVYNSGVLADPRRPTYDYSPAPPALIEKTKQIETVCERHGVPLKAAAIQFPLGHPAVACVLVGCRSAREVEENVGMFEWEIPASLWVELQETGLLDTTAPVPQTASAPR